MPPRRRTSTTPGLVRRPRVAGLAPAAARPGAANAAAGATPTKARPAAPPTGAGTDAAAHAESAEAPPVEPAGAGTPAAPSRWRRLVAALRARPTGTLGVALAVSVVLAAGFGVADHLVRSTPSATNTALADVGATADVLGQVNSALETVYSYDFTQLDENERLAREVITPAFAERFGQLFAQVRQLAPQQKAVVSATVTLSAVQRIEGGRAVVVAFLDQAATRASPGAEPEQLNAAGRLTVTAERDGDAWKIADVANR